MVAISRGHFAPENIIEQWSDKATATHDYGDGIEVQEGRIHVFFTCNSEPFHFEPDHCGDWLLVQSALEAINQAMQPTDLEFEQLEFDALIVIVLLSASEKERIKRERGLSISRVSDAVDAAKSRVWDDESDPFAGEY